MSKNKQEPWNSILEALCQSPSVCYIHIYIGCKYPTANFAHSCLQTQGLSEMIHNYPQVSLMLAFLGLYSILFFIPNLITLHSLQGAAQDSYLPVRQIHLRYFDCSTSFSGLCAYVSSRKILAQDELGNTSQLVSEVTAINFFYYRVFFQTCLFVAFLIWPCFFSSPVPYLVSWQIGHAMVDTEVWYLVSDGFFFFPFLERKKQHGDRMSKTFSLISQLAKQATQSISTACHLNYRKQLIWNLEYFFPCILFNADFSMKLKLRL